MDFRLDGFTDDEILSQLEALGFRDVTDDQMQQLRSELDAAVRHGNWTSGVKTMPDGHYEQFYRGRRLPDQRHLLADSNKVKNANMELVFKENIEPVTVNRRSHVKVEKIKSGNLKPSGPLFKESSNLENYQISDPNKADYSESLFSGSNDIDRLSLASDGSKDSLQSWTSSTKFGQHKRKVLRRRDGVPVVCEERMAYSADASMVSIESNGRKLRQLAVQNDWGIGYSRNEERAVERSSSSNSRFKQISKKWRSLGDLASHSNPPLYKPKSVILPYASQPQAHQFYKTDPVALYHFYKKEWATHKAPGEKDHKELRWNIRTRMALRDEPMKTSRIIKRPLSRLSLFST